MARKLLRSKTKCLRQSVGDGSVGRLCVRLKLRQARRVQARPPGGLFQRKAQTGPGLPDDVAKFVFQLDGRIRSKLGGAVPLSHRRRSLPYAAGAVIAGTPTSRPSSSNMGGSSRSN